MREKYPKFLPFSRAFSLSFPAEKVNAPIEYQLEQAALGDLFTPEAYVWMKKLEFKNMLGRFQMEGPPISLEEYFQEITDVSEARKVFKEAAEAELGGFTSST